jgi:WD40 repeat protein
MVCDNLIAVTDLDGGAVLASVDQFLGAGVLFNPDRSLLAVSFIDNRVELFDAATLESVERLTPAGTRVYSMDFSERGDVFVTGSDTGELNVYGLYPSETGPDGAPGVGVDRWEVMELQSAAGLDGGVFGVVCSPTSHNGASLVRRSSPVVHSVSRRGTRRPARRWRPR